jgi:hypothetical protein
VPMAYSSHLRNRADQALRAARDSTDHMLVKSLRENAAECLGRAEAIDLVESLREAAARLGEGSRCTGNHDLGRPSAQCWKPEGSH